MGQRYCGLEPGVLYMTINMPPQLPHSTYMASNFMFLDPRRMDLHHYMSTELTKTGLKSLNEVFFTYTTEM